MGIKMLRIVVFLEIVELVVIKCLVDVFFFNILTINFKNFIEVHEADIIF
jgi:hypothetical protein